MQGDSNPVPEPINKLFKTSENLRDSQLKSALLTTPFKKIAMALSGGGFRAGAFSLGAMSYLNYLKYVDTDGVEKRVLDNVEFISSASGGTFAGIMYSMHVRKNIPFEETYKQLLKFMSGEVLLEDVLEGLNDDSKWSGEKSRNLINAFSKVYDSKLFGHETFDVYWPKPDETQPRPLEVCFNSTEFYRGISFRFQASTNPKSVGNTGNRYVFFEKFKPASQDTLRKLKLGDIMAASSCFPAGFEPIILPKDFTYADTGGQSLDIEQLRKAIVTTDYDNVELKPSKDVALMDGGVDDNQGLYSAMLADSRRRLKNKDNGFDLIFVTDVASYFMDPYEVPPISSEGPVRQETLNSLLNKPVKMHISEKSKWVSPATVLSGVGFALSLALSIWSNSQKLLAVGLVLSTIFAIGVIALLAVNHLVLKKPLKAFLPESFGLLDKETVSALKDAVPAFKNFSDSTLTLLLKYIRTTRVGILEQMLMARINSMLSMVLDVNLKQTRRLIFDIFFGRFHGEKTWQNRQVFNVIYELSEENVQSRKEILNTKFKEKYGHLANSTGPAPDSWAGDCIELLTADCSLLNQIAEEARTMGTTLWSDAADMANNRIQKVVACGQFTTCAKLLEYVLVIEKIIEKQNLDQTFERQVSFNPDQTRIFFEVKDQLLVDWERFKSQPMFLQDKGQDLSYQS